MKLRKGDTVEVVTGKDKGKQGTILQVLPTADKVIVSGVNTASKHVKARRANQKAGIIDVDRPIHASNVKFVHDGKPVRLGYRVDAKGQKVRIAKLGGGKSEVLR